MTEVTMICGPPRAMMSAFDIILVLCCGELSRLKPLIRIPMAIAYALHLQASSSRVHPQTLPPPPPPHHQLLAGAWHPELHGAILPDQHGHAVFQCVVAASAPVEFLQHISRARNPLSADQEQTSCLLSLSGVVASSPAGLEESLGRSFHPTGLPLRDISFFCLLEARRCVAGRCETETETAEEGSVDTAHC